MKGINTIVQNYKSECMDGRDISRLVQFLSEEQLAEMGLELKDEFKGKHTPKEFTRENILAQLKLDVEFGFEKALNQRGISSSMMHAVVRMWNWILEEGLENYGDYENYGLPTFKATAVKYGFPNPIGDDAGSEEKYSD